MNKASVMNAVTVAAYAAMAVYALVVVVVLGLLVTGGFNRYHGTAEALKFDSIAVSISDNEGSAKIKVVSNNATTTLNTTTGGYGYNDPSNPITLKLELRNSAEPDAKIITPDKAIVEIPSTIVLGEEFEITAIKGEDGFNKGGDCYIHAFSEDDKMRATPIHVFVDVPVQSATLMYYNVTDNLNETYKRVETTTFNEIATTTTLFYNNYTDYVSKTNPIVPLNREEIIDGITKKYIEKDLTCVKNDKFKLYVQVYPERALNPHSIKTINSRVILNNLDSEGIANVCTLLADAYEKASGNEESLEHYVEVFSKTWAKLGLNDLSNLDGLINKEKINQAVAKIRNIDSAAVWQYYYQKLGQQISFNNKTISFETPTSSVAEVNEFNVLEIKQTPQNNASLIDVNVQAIYGANLGNVKIFEDSVSETTSVVVNETSNFTIKEAYFEGLTFNENITKAGVSGRLSVPFNVGNSRLIVSAQLLSDADKQKLLQSTSNDYTSEELNAAVNLGIVIETSGNNAESNPQPLIDQMKNLVLEQVTTNSVMPLTITPDTTLGDTNIIWLITPNRRLEDGEGLSLSLSLSQEIKVENLNTEDAANLGADEVVYSIENDCYNLVKYKVGSTTIAQKISTIKQLGFTIEIRTAAIQYESNVNLKIEKRDYDGGNTNYEIDGQPTGYVNVNSLIKSVDGVEGAVYNPSNYTYGKIVYFASYSDEGKPIDRNVINVTGNSEGTQFYGQLLYSFASEGSDDLYTYIQGMGAGEIIVTPYLVMTERKNGKEYPVDSSYNRIENIAEAELTSFVRVKAFNSIKVNVTEVITKFHYYTNNNFKAENEYTGATDDKFFATGASNMLTFYIRANSNLALPGDAKEYESLGYIYTYKVWAGSTEVRDEVILDYPEEIMDVGGTTQIVSKQFGTNEGINYMAINVTVNPLKSTNNKTYTIKWYQGSTEVPNSTLEINAKDYYGNESSMSFDKDALVTSLNSEYKATFTLKEGATYGEYKVKWANSEVVRDKFNLPNVYCMQETPTEGETWPYIQPGVYVSQSQINTYTGDGDVVITEYIPNYVIKYYWLLKDDAAEGGFRYSTNPLTSSEEGSFITHNLDDNCLYIKSMLPSAREGCVVSGIVISCVYSPNITGLPNNTALAKCDYTLKLDWPVSFVYGTPDNWTLTGSTINVALKYLIVTYESGETVALKPSATVLTHGVIGGESAAYNDDDGTVSFVLSYNGTPAQLSELNEIEFNRGVKFLFTIASGDGVSVDSTYVGPVTVSKA